MPNAIQSKRRSKLLAAGAMALTLTIGGGLLASGSAFAASADTSSQAQSQTSSTSPSKGEGHFGHRGGGFQLGAYESKLAAYLNLDEATLRTKLQTQTLAEVAEAQGITRETLKTQLVAWIDEAKAADSAATSTSNPDKPAQPDSSSIADKLLDAKGGKGAFGGGMDGKQQRGPGGFRGFDVDRDQLASALNLTADELKEAAQSGKTLATIAEAQGISRDTLKAQLVAWIEAARTAASANAADSSSATGAQKQAIDSSTLADKLLDSPLGGAGKEAHAGGFGGGLRALDSDAIAGALGITADELKTSLASGKTMAGLATEKGVDVQQVIDAVTASMKSRLDQQLSDGKLTQEQYDQQLASSAEKASAIVNGQMGPHGKHGRPGAGSTSGEASNTAEDSSQ